MEIIHGIGRLKHFTGDRKEGLFCGDKGTVKIHIHEMKERVTNRRRAPSLSLSFLHTKLHVYRIITVIIISVHVRHSLSLSLFESKLIRDRD